jgi:dolichol-phosphate mannosyltransferase
MSRSPVGIVVPTFREAENIGPLISALHVAAPGAAIVVVDDSPDLATVTAVEALSDPDVEVVHRHGKGGRGSAVLSGMGRLLKYPVETIVEIDADHSHPPSELPALLEHARRHQLDLLIASRYLERSRIENWPLTRRVFSRTANMVARSTLRVPVRDYTNGYRLYSRRAAELVVERCGHAGSGFIALSEILVTVHCHGMRIGEHPTVFVNRIRGESSVNTREVLGAVSGLWSTIQLRRRLRRTADHARLS